MLRNKENPHVGPDGQIVQPRLLTWLILMVHNFVNIDQISTKPVPIDSPGQDLSIGTDLVKIWPVLTKLWTMNVNHANSPGWTNWPVGPTIGFSLFLSIIVTWYSCDIDTSWDKATVY